MKKKNVVGADQRPTPEQLIEMYDKLDGQTKEIKAQYRRGALNDRHTQALVEHRNPFAKKAEVSAVVPFEYDKTKDGWKLVERGLEAIGSFVPDVVSFLKDNEPKISGYEMLGRAKYELNANLGQLDAEWLEEHQEVIPKEWQGKYYLVFPGTVWLRSDGRLYVPYLRWYGGRWCLRFHWLGCGWGSDDRLVRPRG